MPNTLDHDNAPQYLGPTLSMTSTVTAPQTHSKTSYVCRAPRTNATTAGGNKHQRTENGSNLDAGTNQYSRTARRKEREMRRGESSPVGQEERVARPRCEIDEDEIWRDGPHAMVRRVPSGNSGAQTGCGERAGPHDQYWRRERQEPRQEQQDVFRVVRCGGQPAGFRFANRRTRGAWGRGRRIAWRCGDVCCAGHEVDRPAA